MKSESSEARRDSIDDVLDEALAQVLVPPPLPSDFRVGLNAAVARAAKRAPARKPPSEAMHDCETPVESTAAVHKQASAKHASTDQVSRGIFSRPFAALAGYVLRLLPQYAGPDIEHDRGKLVRIGAAERDAHLNSVAKRSSRRAPYDDSISEFREHLAWARRLASIVFIAGIVLLLGDLTVFCYFVTHTNNAAAFTVLKLLVANLVAAVPVILLFSVGYAFLNHISRTHDELTTAFCKRDASLLADDPAVRARLVDILLEVDRNPKLKQRESVADIEPTRRPLES
jgi:hypothetical protein